MLHFKIPGSIHKYNKIIYKVLFVEPLHSHLIIPESPNQPFFESIEKTLKTTNHGTSCA